MLKPDSLSPVPINRTLRLTAAMQDQFVNSHIDGLYDLDSFNRQLMQYLIWYNTEKPHRGIGKLAPLRYFLDNFSTPLKSNMLWTLTVT